MKRIPRWLSFLLVLGVIVAIGGGAAFYFITRQPESFITQKIIRPVVGFISGFKQFEEVEGRKADFEISSAELQEAFAKDEVQAKTIYGGKLIQVTGIISNIASHSDTNRVVLLEVDGLSNVSCQMDPMFKERLHNLSPGSLVVIKGICSGSKKDDLLGSQDVLLNRCVIAK